MLTEREIEKIFSWLPYREDWPVNRNEKVDNIEAYFGKLIVAFLNNTNFNCIQMETGGMSNYIDFMCYRKGDKNYKGQGILVMVNLCAPISAFGITQINVSEKAWGNNGITPKKIGVINAPELGLIEKCITNILSENNIEIIDRVFASQILPNEVYESLEMPFSNKYLYGLFQMAS